jgi:carboxymethylenebutenolidase
MVTAILIFLGIASGRALAAQPSEVTFPSGRLTLSGFVYKPEGKAPFPAVLYNHGSERKPGSKPELGGLFSGKGYVFFVPHRRGHGRSPDDPHVDSLYNQGLRGAVALHEVHLEDQLAALNYLKGLPYVDTNKIFVAGCSYGGIQTILAVEANAEMKLGLRAAVDFAGAAMTWARAPNVRDRLFTAVRKATIPVLFVQAENDYDLSPSRALAQELEKLGKPHKVVIFPPYGKSAADGHGGFCFRGGDVWGAEVFSFLASVQSR